MYIERLPNQQVNMSIGKVTATEKTKPTTPVEDVLKRPDQHVQEEAKQVLSKEKMEEVVKGMNDFIQPVNTSIKFELHDKLNDYYVTIVDDKTNEVIREIPSKKLLDTYANMMEFVGILVDKKI